MKRPPKKTADVVRLPVPQIATPDGRLSLLRNALGLLRTVVRETGDARHRMDAGDRAELFALARELVDLGIPPAPPAPPRPDNVFPLQAGRGNRPRGG